MATDGMELSGKPNEDDGGLSAPTLVIMLVTAAVLLAVYTLLSHRGLWGDVDTRAFTVFGQALLEGGSLLLPGEVYPHGYAYPALLVYLSAMSGMSISAIQLFWSGLLMVWLVLPAWLLYREFTGKATIAALATVILFVQPEFLFPVMRGSHEKFTRGLMLVALYLFVRSLRSNKKLGDMTVLLLGFYLTVYAAISFNNLLTTSFIIATAVAAFLTWLIARFRGSSRTELAPASRRLVYASAISIVLTFLFIFYIYTPALNDLLLLDSTGERMSALILDVDQATETEEIYGLTITGWLSPQVYLLVSLANWLLLGAAGLIWLWQSARWALGRWRPGQSGELLTWAFCGAFALITAVSVVVDYSGGLAGNFQLRAFPAFAILAAPLIAKWLSDVLSARSEKTTKRIYLVLGFGLAILAALSILKFTTDTLVSNQWLFSVPAEVEAINWSDRALANRFLWADYDERLTAAAGIRAVASPLAVRLDKRFVDPGVRNLLISDVMRDRISRWSLAAPYKGDSFVTYDNGQAQIYHLRPETIYQD